MVHSGHSHIGLSHFAEPDRYKFSVEAVMPYPVAFATSEPMAALIQVCSESFPPSISEVAEVGCYTLSSTRVCPSDIAESPTRIECRPRRTADFGHKRSRSQRIVGEIVAVRPAEGVVSGHRVSHQSIDALGRIVGRSNCRTEDKSDV